MDFVDPSVRTVYEPLDLIGVVLYGMIGGIIDNGPPAALQDMRYFGLALAGALASMLIHLTSSPPSRTGIPQPRGCRASCFTVGCLIPKWVAVSHRLHRRFTSPPARRREGCSRR